MGSSSSSSSSSSGEDGKWKNQIYFDPKADQPGEGYLISDSELQQKFKELIDVKERIQKVWIYTHPLYTLQLTQLLMFHAYVVLETDTWYWSVEKNSEGITIQRSKTLEYVRGKYRRRDRRKSINES
jgi:hypothetical protein